MHVVARLQAVAEDARRLAAQQPLGEDGDDAGLALGVLARAVDVGVAQDQRLEVAEAAVGEQVELDGELAAAVGRQRPRRVVLVAGERLLLAVDGAAAAGEEDAAHAGVRGRPG